MSSYLPSRSFPPWEALHSALKIPARRESISSVCWSPDFSPFCLLLLSSPCLKLGSNVGILFNNWLKSYDLSPSRRNYHESPADECQVFGIEFYSTCCHYVWCANHTFNKTVDKLTCHSLWLPSGLLPANHSDHLASLNPTSLTILNQEENLFKDPLVSERSHHGPYDPWHPFWPSYQRFTFQELFM